MDREAHLERWSAATEAFKAATGREVSAYAVVLVDETGEVYYGGSFGWKDSDHAALLNRLSVIRGDLKDFIKVAEKRKGATHHEWDRDGERCVKCGAKDWMGGECTPKANGK
jgi:hypothetical protein